VIERTARDRNAPFIRVTPDKFAAHFRDGATVRLPGEHQKINAALALATVDALQNQIRVSPEAMRSGLATVNWPGRLQLIQRPSGQQILLDGAHNVAGARVLGAALAKNFPAPDKTLILGVFQDKDWRTMCKLLAPLAARILTVPISSERTANAGELAAACRVANPAAEVAACESLGTALEQAAGDPFVVIAGSLYLVGEALEWLGQPPAAGERELNEWRTPIDELC